MNSPMVDGSCLHTRDLFYVDNDNIVVSLRGMITTLAEENAVAGTNGFYQIDGRSRKHVLDASGHILKFIPLSYLMLHWL